ncbi:hypothetical protein CPB86DRAFT_599766 [Serendipita vermifera]|nr:hypothetical protein CPB86DRAFT_599766 [Serendipita vermifera]
MTMPKFLMTALDAEQEGDRPLTYKAEFMIGRLPEHYQEIWIHDNPNQNPPTKLVHDMLESPDPSKPNQVRCPRKGCPFRSTRCRVAAHMLEKNHAILPVFHCYHNNMPCKRYFRVSERDRHRETAHGVPRPRVRRYQMEAQVQGASQSLIQSEPPLPFVQNEASSPSQTHPPDTWPTQSQGDTLHSLPSNNDPNPMLFNEAANNHQAPVACKSKVRTPEEHPDLISSSWATALSMEAHVNTAQSTQSFIPVCNPSIPIPRSVMPSISDLENVNPNNPSLMAPTEPTPPQMEFFSPHPSDTYYRHYSTALIAARTTSLDLQYQGIQRQSYPRQALGRPFPSYSDNTPVYTGTYMGKPTDSGGLGSIAPLSHYPIPRPSSSSSLEHLRST